MKRPRFESFLPPEQIETVFGNTEAVKELARLEVLHAQVGGELKELQARLRETYDEDDRERIVELLTPLRELSQKLLAELRRIQGQFPRTNEKATGKR